MKKLFLNLLFLSFSPMLMVAQNVGISADNVEPHPSAILDVQSNDKGVLIPRVALQGTTDVETIKDPATSLLIYNTADATDLKPGFYYFNGNSWEPMTARGEYTTEIAISPIHWSERGNKETNPNEDFIGTTDNEDLSFRTNDKLFMRLTTKGQLEFYNTNQSVFIGEEAGESSTGTLNVGIGHQALNRNTTGSENSAVGYRALYLNTTGSGNSAIGKLALYNNTTGYNNTAIGKEILYLNTTGSENSAIGYRALYLNTTGSGNSAIGQLALYRNSTGSNNTAIGRNALYRNTFGNQNTASGTKALYNNTTGSYNTANGYEALNGNTTGTFNSGNGYQALFNNSTGGSNSANGTKALYNNTTGSRNTATGTSSLYTNQTGSNNTANGIEALYNNINGRYNTATGSRALFKNTSHNNSAYGYQALYNNIYGRYNTALGYNAFLSGTSYHNSTALGSNTVITSSNQIRLGNSAVSSIGGFAGWTNVSDARFKTNIREEVAGLDFINALRPVTYNLDMDAIAKFNNVPEEARLPKEEAKKAAIVQTGFIAQEVEEVAKKLGYDFSGVDAPQDEKDHYGLRYAEFTVPLVKAVQELSQENKELIAQNKELAAKQKAMESELAEIKALLKTTASK